MKKIYSSVFIKKTLVALLLSIFVFTANTQTMIPLPTFGTAYSGNTRGMWFTAPANFTIIGLKVPTDVGTGAQSIHLVRFPTIPPTYTTTTTTFTTLYYGANIASTGYITVNIQVNAGDVIGVLGARNNGSGTGLTSYANTTAAFATTIAGASTTLYRLGWQGSVLTSPAANFWYEASTVGRIEILYTTTSGYNNAGVLGVTEPVNFCAGTYDVKAKIGNKGQNTLTSFNVNWTINGTTQTPLSWTGSLDTVGGSGKSDTILNLGSVVFPSGVTKNIKIWTSLPNGVADTVNADDTVNAVLKPALNGTFTIGGTSPDYPTVVAAAADLTANGVCGPVTFNIRTGTYAGQVALGTITGASATNTITFQSQANHRDSVTITFASTALAEGVLKITGASYVKFKSVKFSQTNTTASSVIYLSGTCTKDTIENCIIMSAATSTAGTYDIYTTASTIDGLVIRNNLITGAYYGMYIYGATANYLTNCVIEGNTIQNIYLYIGYLYYHTNMKFRNNIVNMNTTGASQTFYIYYHTGSVFANNVVTSASNVTTITMNLFYSGTNVGVYNNTFNLSNTAGTGITFHNYLANNYQVKNNVFVNNANWYAATCYYSPTTYAIISDNNMFYTGGSILINQVSAAATYANLNAWRTAYPTLDKNSISYRPGLISATNAQPNVADSACWALNGRGIHLAAVTTDINGNPRPATVAAGVPDIGAYEFTPTSTPPLATPTTAPSMGGTQAFLFAGDTLAKVIWDGSLTPPTALYVRQYTGTKPLTIGAAPYYTYMYNTLTPSNSGTFSYDLKMYYKDAWLGTMANENNMVVAQNSPMTTGNWANCGTTSVDSANNILTAQYLTNFGWFTGSDISSPVPVTLLDLNANVSGKNVLVNWITASEQNSDRFEVQRAVHCAPCTEHDWQVLGNVKAAGNSNTYQSYLFTDAGALSLSKGTLYYRLAIYDRDGHMEYSKVVSVSENTQPEITLFPNPFNNQLVLNMSSAEAGNVNVVIVDMNGKQQFSTSLTVAKGVNTKVLEGFEGLPGGVYFARVSTDAEVKVIKLIKK